MHMRLVFLEPSCVCVCAIMIIWFDGDNENYGKYYGNDDGADDDKSGDGKHHKFLTGDVFWPIF